MNAPSAQVPDRGELTTAGEWLESPALARFATRIATQYRLKPDDLLDLLQETRIALWESGAQTPINAAWVVRVISNKAVDIVRRARRFRACDSELAYSTTGGAPEPELEHLLHACVSELPARLREFYRLHYLEGRSEREIATRLGLCRGSVRWLDHCCRSRIIGQRSSTRGH